MYFVFFFICHLSPCCLWICPHYRTPATHIVDSPFLNSSSNTLSPVHGLNQSSTSYFSVCLVWKTPKIPGGSNKPPTSLSYWVKVFYRLFPKLSRCNFSFLFGLGSCRVLFAWRSFCKFLAYASLTHRISSASLSHFTSIFSRQYFLLWYFQLFHTCHPHHNLT